MLFRNREQDRAFDFIANSDFDIFCLQEVPSVFLARLKTLPYHLVETTDVERLFGEVVPNHLVVLSRYPITRAEPLAWPDYWPLLPLRTKIFVYLMRPWHWSRIQNRNGLSADIAAPSGSLHVFNLHTVLTNPSLRLQEFERVVAERDPARPGIVCGDFNTIESPRISILNWFVGGSPADALFWRRERTRIERCFVEHELVNPLRGSVTHPFSRSQLDHILVSHTFTIKNADVLKDRVGSDHHPIRVEIS